MLFFPLLIHYFKWHGGREHCDLFCIYVWLNGVSKGTDALLFLSIEALKLGPVEVCGLSNDKSDLSYQTNIARVPLLYERMCVERLRVSPAHCVAHSSPPQVKVRKVDWSCSRLNYYLNKINSNWSKACKQCFIYLFNKQVNHAVCYFENKKGMFHWQLLLSHLY